MKKLVSLALVLALSIMVCAPTFAKGDARENDSTNRQVNLIELLNDGQYVRQQETRINESLGIRPEAVEQYRTWLKISQEKGYFHSDGNGHILVDPTDKQITPDGMWENYLSRIDTINELIDIGIVSFSEEKGLVSHALECIKNPSIMKFATSSNEYKPNAEIFDLGGEVHNNFQQVNSVYSSQGYVIAVAFWIGKVQPYGDWDYKNQPGLTGQSFMCYYGSDDSKHALHRTDWIGNYNYGYTGHLLFALSILHAGSAAVGGGPVVDQEDWPAIDEGYDDSGIIEW